MQKVSKERRIHHDHCSAIDEAVRRRGRSRRMTCRSPKFHWKPCADESTFSMRCLVGSGWEPWVWLSSIVSVAWEWYRWVKRCWLLAWARRTKSWRRRMKRLRWRNSNLKRIKKSSSAWEWEKLKKMDRRNEEVRWYTKCCYFASGERDSKPWEDEALGKKGKWSLPCCRFTKPPHSSTAMQDRHRWMLRWVCEGSSTVKSNSPGSMAPVQGMRSLKKEWPVFFNSSRDPLPILVPMKAFVLRVWEKVPRSWRIVCYSDSVLLGLLIFHRLQHLMSFTSFVIPPFVDAELG